MDVHKIAVISANLGGVDRIQLYPKQSQDHSFYSFNDDNFPIRSKALAPRLQAKIPKCFAWQLIPDCDFYLWLDGNITLAHEDSLKYLMKEIEGHDIVVLRHPRRPNIRQEVRYTRKGLREQSTYMVNRYEGEWLKQFYDLVQADKDFEDDLLVNGGAFLYRNTPQVQAMLKEWWYYQTRYILQDQVSFPYVLKKSGIKIKVLEEIFNDCWFLRHESHRQRNK